MDGFKQRWGRWWKKNKERCSGWCLNQRHNWSKYWEWVTVEYWLLNEVSVPHSPMPKKHQKEVTGRFGEPEDDRTAISIVFRIWHGVHNQDHTTVLATWHLHTETYITWKWEEDYKRACCIIIKWQQIEHICENFKNKRGKCFWFLMRQISPCLWSMKQKKRKQEIGSWYFHCSVSLKIKSCDREIIMQK